MKPILTLFVLASALPSETHAPAVNRLVFGGDVMLARHVYRLAQSSADPARPFREIAREFASADLAFVNLESPVISAGPHFEERMVFRAHPSMVRGLKFAGIDIVSTANNHARDAGGEGILSTLTALDAHGIAAVGTAADPRRLRDGVVLERNGVRFGFLAYTSDQRNGNHRDNDPRVAMADLDAMTADLPALRRRADVVIVSLHAGIEYASRPTYFQQAFSRAAIDAGASVVVGHHPHTVQPVERYRNGLILYSLGNLVFDQFHRNPTGQGMIAEVIFSGAGIAAYVTRDIEIRDTVPRLSPPVIAFRR